MRSMERRFVDKGVTFLHGCLIILSDMIELIVIAKTFISDKKKVELTKRRRKNGYQFNNGSPT